MGAPLNASYMHYVYQIYTYGLQIRLNIYCLLMRHLYHLDTEYVMRVYSFRVPLESVDLSDLCTFIHLHRRRREFFVSAKMLT